MINQILTVNVDPKIPKYKVKWLVAFNQDWMIKTIESLGGEQYLENNQIFAVCFDTTPKDQLDSMGDYKEVLDKFPRSYHILDKVMYIGNYNQKDWLDIVHQSLEYWSKDLNGEGSEYEIVAVEGGFTK